MKRMRSDFSPIQQLPKRLCVQSRRGKRETDFDFISKDDYVAVGDFLYVRPYVFEFKTNFKPRWKDKSVYQVFSQEFRHAESLYWTKEFAEGKVLCGGKPVGLQKLWEDGMEVIHVVHRHESPVLSQKVHVAENHQGYVVVSKPPSLPVHPCGTYRRNSLQFILKAFYGMGKLHAVHRLDKETSGLVILAKTAEYASRFSADIKDHKVLKTYLAEVEGLVPWEKTESNERIYWDKKTLRAYVRNDGAQAATVFKRISLNANKGTTVLECQPHTGRTHQIRIHLMHLGFPIVNDTMYELPGVSGETKVAVSVEPQSLTLRHPAFQNEATVNEKRRTFEACEWSRSALERNKRHLSCLEEGRALSCSNCPQITNIKNVEVRAMFIHLHALKYESEGWSFKVPLPPWALEAKKHNKEKNVKTRMCAIA